MHMRVLVVLLLFRLVQAGESVPALCRAVNSQTVVLPSVDAFSGQALSSFAWIQKECVAQGGKSFSFDTGWTSTTELTVTASNVSASNIMLRRSIVVQLSSTIQFQITVGFKLTLNGTLNSESFSSTVEGEISKAATQVPLDGGSSLPCYWKGALTSLPDPNVRISDVDLFDGKIFEILLHPQVPNHELLTLVDSIQPTVADPTLRMFTLKMEPSALIQAPVQGAFLSSSQLPPSNYSNPVGGTLWASSTNEVGVLVQTKTECVSYNCTESLVNSLTRIVQSSSGSLCTNLIAIRETFSSQLTTSLFVTPGVIEVRSLGARTQGLFLCGSNSTNSPLGYVGVSLSFASPLPDGSAGWPTSVFLNDKIAAANLIRTIPIKLGGRMGGTAIINKEFHSVIRQDLFSSSQGGVMVSDVPFSAFPSEDPINYVVTLFEKIASELTYNSPLSLLTEAVRQVFPTDLTRIEQLIELYTAQIQQPSILGFFSWYFEHAVLNSYQLGSFISLDDPPLSSFISLDGHQLTLSVNIKVQGDLTVLGDPVAIQEANAKLNILGTKLMQEYSKYTNGYKIPIIDKTVVNITGKMSGFLTALVVINDIQSSPKVLLRSPATTSATTSLEAKFAGGNNLFVCANVLFDHSLQLTTVQACIAPELTVSIPGPMIGITEDGSRLVFDGTWENSASLAVRLRSIAEKIDSTKWAYGQLVGIDYSFGVLTPTITFGDVVLAIAELVASNPDPIRAWDLANSIANVIVSKADGDPSLQVSARVLPLKESKTLHIDVLVYSQRLISISGNKTAWKFVVGTGRAKMPMKILTHLIFTVNPASDNLTEFSVKGGAQLEGWTAPVAFNMLSGSAVNTSTKLDLNLPSSGTLTISMDIITRLAGLIHARMFVANLTDQEAPAIFNVTLPSAGTYGELLPATSVLSSVRDGVLKVLPRAFTSSLNIAITPISDTLGSINSWAKLTEIVEPWLTVLDVSSPKLVVSEVICPSTQQQPLELNITVNQGPIYQCSCTKLNMTNMDTIKDSVNQMLKVCMLDQYLTTVVADEDNASGHLALIPSVPGIIWDFNITTADQGGNVSFGGHWSASNLPSFGTWEEFSCLLDRLFDHETALPPNYTTFSADVLIPPHLRDVYPPQLHAVEINSSVIHSTNSLFNITSRISANDDIVAIDLHNNTKLFGSVTTSITNTLVTVFNVPPLGGFGNLTLLSSFNSTWKLNATVVPPAPNNVFSLTIQAQLRTPYAPTNPTEILNTQIITLTPGKLLGDALLSEVEQQLNQDVKPMLSVSFFPATSIINPDPQVKFVLSYASFQNNNKTAWLIPLSIGISNFANLPCLNNATNSALPAITLSKGLIMNLSLLAQATPLASGRYAVLDVTSSDVNLNHRLDVTARSNKEFLYISELFPSRASFFNRFTVGVAINASVAIDKAEFNVNPNFDIPTLLLGMQRNWLLTSQDDLKNMTQEISLWTVSVIGVDTNAMNALEALLKSNKSACQWMTITNAMLQSITGSRLINQYIPFSQHSFSSLLDDGVGGVIESVTGRMCGKKATFSLDILCQILKNSFGADHELCSTSELTTDHLWVDVVVTFDRSFNDQFRFDTPTLFQGTSMPPAVGSQGAITMNTTFSLKLRLAATFEPNAGLIISLNSDFTETSLTASFLLVDNVKARFGPLPTVFDGTYSTLGPATVVARLPSQANEDVSITILGKASFDAIIDFESTVQCGLSVGIDSLMDFFKGHPPSVTEKSCGDGFLAELEKALSENSLFKYFENHVFEDQWESEVITKILALPAKLGKINVPLVGNLLPAIIRDANGELNTAKAMKFLQAEITKLTNYIRKQVPHDVEQFLLDHFTKDILCKAFQDALAPCPPAPKVNPEHYYTWPLTFQKRNSRPVANFGFHLGDHGLASLDLTCTASLVMEWVLHFDLKYNTTQGLFFEFTYSQLFMGSITLELDPGCELSGSIGLVGADIKPETPEDDVTELKGTLQIDNHFQPKLEIVAQIYGVAEIGLGPLLTKILHVQGLDTLPHWQVSLQASWQWDLIHGTTTPHLKFSKNKFCIGRLLGKVLTNALSEVVRDFLDALQPVLGAAGILLKPIPGVSDVFGNDLNVIQIAHLFCQGKSDCEFEGVVEALDTFNEIYKRLATLKDLASKISVDSCGPDEGIVQELQDFAVDFTQEVVKPIFSGNPPKPGLQYYGKDKNVKEQVNTLYSSVANSKIGVILYLSDMKQIGEALVKAFLGDDFPLVGITLPDVTLNLVNNWHFMVYSPPPIFLVLGIEVDVRLGVGQVLLTYRGLAEAVKNGSPAMMLGALAMPTTNDDGSVRYPLQATFKVTGGVEVSVGVLMGRAYFSIVLKGTARFVDIDKNGWVTFNEIFYLIEYNQNAWAAVQIDIDLGAILGISLRACFPFGLFGGVCVTLIDKQWTFEWPLYHSSNSYPSISDGQAKINLDFVGPFPHHRRCAGKCSAKATQSTISTYRIYTTPSGDLTVSYAPEGASFDLNTPLFSRRSLTSDVVTSSGNPGNLPFNWLVDTLNVVVRLPDFPTVNLIYLYQGANTISISPSLVSTESAPGVIIQRCGSIFVANASTYTLTGVPCITSIDSQLMNNVSISGLLSAYSNPVEIKGTSLAVNVNVEANTYYISSSSISADTSGTSSTLQVSLPPNYLLLSITGNRIKSSTYIVSDVMAGCSAKISGNQDDDIFVLQMNLLEGNTFVEGGAGIDAANLTIITEEGVPMYATASAYSLVTQTITPSVVHTLRHNSVENRSYFLIGAPNTVSQLTLIAPIRDDSIHSTAVGAPGSTIWQYVTGCDGQSDMRLFLRNGGQHVVQIGNNHKISDFKCTVWVYGSSDPQQNDTIFVEADLENRALAWDLQQGALLVRDIATEQQFFHLLFFNIEQVIINFGSGGTTFTMTTGTVGTEYLFNFTSSSQQVPSNTMRIITTNSPILIIGNVTELGLGEPKSPLSAVDPLKEILAPIALVQPPQRRLLGNASIAQLRMDSGVGPQAPVQRFYLDERCLAQLSPNGTIINTPINQSSWMCTQMGAFGFPTCQACPLVYSGFIELFIETGWADDLFIGENVSTASVNIHLGPGADKVVWRSVQSVATSEDAQLLADLGPGPDTFIAILFLRNTVVLAGQDSDTDDINIFYDKKAGVDPPQQIEGNVIGPISPYPSSINNLTMYQLREQDLISIRSESPVVKHEVPPNYIATEGVVVVINVTVAGSVFKLDMDSETTYKVVGCASGATIALDAQGRAEPPQQPAYNWTVVIDIDIPLEQTAYIDIWALKGTNGILIVNIGSKKKIVYKMVIEQLVPPGLGHIVVGGLQVRASWIEHLLLRANQSSDIEISKTPADADLVVVGTQNAQTVVTLTEMLNNALLINVTARVSGDAIRSNISVISVGQKGNTLLDYYFERGISFVDGCLKSPGFIFGTMPFSEWMIQQNLAVGVNTYEAVNCSYYTKQTASLNVSTPNMNVTDLDKYNNVYRLVLTGDNSTTLLLHDQSDQTWKNTSIDHNSLKVDERMYVLMLTAGGMVQLMSPVFGRANESQVQIQCSQGNLKSSLVWLLGSTQATTSIHSKGTCDVRMLSSVTRGSDLYLPFVYINETKNALINVAFSNNNTIANALIIERAISIRAFSFEATNIASNYPFVRLNWAEEPTIMLSVIIENGNNNVVLEEDPTTPYLKIQGNETTVNLTLPFEDASINLLNMGKHIGVDPQTSSIKPGNDNMVYCFQPAMQCKDREWLRMEYTLTDKRLPCRTKHEAQQCINKLKLNLSTTLPIFCRDEYFFNVSLVLSKNTDGWSSAPYFPLGWWYVGLFFFFSTISIIAWIIWGRVIPLGWLCLVITGYLRKAIPPSVKAHLHVTSLLEGANWLVSSLFTYCEPYGLLHYIFIAFWMGAISVSTLILIPVIRPRMELLGRILLGITMFWGVPFMFFQTQLETSATSVLAIFSFLLLVVAAVDFLLYTWLFPPLWTRQKRNRSISIVLVLQITLTLGGVYIASIFGRDDIYTSPTLFVVISSVLIVSQGFADCLSLWLLIGTRPAYSNEEVKLLNPDDDTSSPDHLSRNPYMLILCITTTLLSTAFGLTFALMLRTAPDSSIIIFFWLPWLLPPMISMLLCLLARYCLTRRRQSKMAAQMLA